jgi:hypothetical protein
MGSRSAKRREPVLARKLRHSLSLLIPLRNAFDLSRMDRCWSACLKGSAIAFCGVVFGGVVDVPEEEILYRPGDYGVRRSLLEWASKTESQDWLHLRQFRLLKNYVAAGRRYRNMPIAQLRAAWIDIYRRNTRQPVAELAHQEHELDAEFLIRHAPLPLGAVRNEMKLRIDAAVADVILHCRATAKDALEPIPSPALGRHGH